MIRRDGDVLRHTTAEPAFANARLAPSPQTVRKILDSCRSQPTTSNDAESAFAQVSGTFRQEPSSVDNPRNLVGLFELYYDI